MDLHTNENLLMDVTVRYPEADFLIFPTPPFRESIQKKFNQVNDVDLRDSTFFEMISQTGRVDF